MIQLSSSKDKIVDRSLPKITIVTPSLNQGRFIEETIKSILNQGYPNLEYFVIDGGSTDETMSIIKKYDEHIDFWTSEPDNGQAAAINKGFAKASGQILAWLNSDDTYESGVFAEVAKMFERHPEADVISGRCRIWSGDARDRLIAPSPLRCFDDFLKIRTNWTNDRLIVQPEGFFRRRAFEKIGRIREDLYYVFDACMWMDMARTGCIFQSVDQHWANLRVHKDQKISSVTGTYEELARLAWDQLRGNWTRVENPLAVAEDIFAVLDLLLKNEQNMSKTLRESTSYRVGRLLTQMKFW
jgi:glycosyltransferase involved in cell wall biosynthesis